MPPQQCPACGRFLKKDLVAALTDEPTPCPKCEHGLVAEMFDDEAAGADAGADDVADSVRPPDLRPDRVRDDAGAVLEGWDGGTGPPSVVDRAPFPTDLVVLVGAGLAGAAMGALVGERGWRGAMLGAAGGVAGAAAARQLWRSP